MTSRATIYFDSKLYRAAKIKAAHTDISVSQLVNDALKLALKEDSIDIEAIGKRGKESARGLESVLIDLKRDGLL